MYRIVPFYIKLTKANKQKRIGKKITHESIGICPCWGVEIVMLRLVVSKYDVKLKV